MPNTATRNARRHVEEMEKPVKEQVRALKADATEYLTDYVRENPGYAALWCVGIGFVLGWKLKPW